MSVRHLGMREWQLECAATLKTAPANAEPLAVLRELMGWSPGGAAGVLGISRQRVHQLVAAGQLDAVYVWEERKPKGAGARPSMIMILEPSMELWRKSKPGEQCLLPIGKVRRRFRA